MALPRLLFGLALAIYGLAAQAEDFTTLKGHGGPVMGLSVSPSGAVASGSFDNSVGLWNGQDPRWLEGHDAAVVDVLFIDDQTIVSGGDDFSVWIWRDGVGQVLGKHLGKVTDLEVTADGRHVASASWDGTVGLWSLEDEEQSFFFPQHDAGFSDVDFSADGERIYAATSAGEILVYNRADAGQPRVLVRNGFGINEMILASDESWLAYGAVDGVTRVVDASTGIELKDFTLDRRPILAMAYSEQTRQIAVGDGHGFIMIIDADDWRIARDFRAMRQGPVWALTFGPDGHDIYAGGLDDVVYRWPVALLDAFEPAGQQEHSFLRDVAQMSNGERQFMRKCSICHALEEGASRKAGPSLHNVFGREAGTLPGYRYSETLLTSGIIWSRDTIDALFDIGPDHYIPASKMPQQRITAPEDRQDLIDFLIGRTTPEKD